MPLERQRNAASGVFQNSALLNDNKLSTFRIEIEHHKLCSENSARSMRSEIIEQQGFWRLASNYRTVKWLMWVESTSFNNVMIDLPNQRTWYRMKMSERFCRWLAKWTLTKFLLEHFRCTLPAPGKKTLAWYTKSLCRFSECCSTDHIKEISYWKAHLETVIYRMPASRLSTFALYGETDLSSWVSSFFRMERNVFEHDSVFVKCIAYESFALINIWTNYISLYVVKLGVVRCKGLIF